MSKSTSTSFWDQPITHLEEALQLRKQIEALQQKLSALLAGETAAAAPKVRKKRGPAPKAKKTAAAAKAAPAAPASPASPAKSKRGKRGTMSPEAKAKISAAMKARWEAKKTPAE